MTFPPPLYDGISRAFAPIGATGWSFAPCVYATGSALDYDTIAPGFSAPREWPTEQRVFAEQNKPGFYTPMQIDPVPFGSHLRGRLVSLRPRMPVSPVVVVGHFEQANHDFSHACSSGDFAAGDPDTHDRHSLRLASAWTSAARPVWPSARLSLYPFPRWDHRAFTSALHVYRAIAEALDCLTPEHYPEDGATDRDLLVQVRALRQQCHHVGPHALLYPIVGRTRTGARMHPPLLARLIYLHTVEGATGVILWDRPAAGEAKDAQSWLDWTVAECEGMGLVPPPATDPVTGDV